jgi:dolichol-phosphate mannosyltransferase
MTDDHHRLAHDPDDERRGGVMSAEGRLAELSVPYVAPPKPLLSVVICTLDESEAIVGVLREAGLALADLPHELIVVDDSTDDRTADAVQAVRAAQPNVKLVRRQGERGLGSAVIAGWTAAEGAVLGVMDGDGQHDPQMLLKLYAALHEDDADVAVGSRYMEEGPSGLTGFRAALSRGGTALVALTLGLRIADPLSGLFLVRRDWVEAVRPRLSGVGFKILVDTVASGRRQPVVAQVPTALRPRGSGQSKLDLRVILDLAALLIEKRTGGLLSARFILFAGVGLSGMAANLAVLSAAHALGARSYALSAGVATLVAMMWNFLLNNVLTFRERRLHGAAFWRGLLMFCLASATGGLIAEAVGLGARGLNASWMTAGALGALAGGILNYLLASRLSWIKAAPDAGNGALLTRLARATRG